MNLLRRIKLKAKSCIQKTILSSKKNVSINGKITIDDYSGIYVVGNAKLRIGSLYMNSYSTITARYDVSIGDNVMFGENVHVYDHNHIFTIKDVPFSKQGFNYKPVVIGDNCWIGSGVIILAGAEIGNNCVIGANCIIGFKVPDNSIVRCDRNCAVEEIRFSKEE